MIIHNVLHLLWEPAGHGTPECSAATGRLAWGKLSFKKATPRSRDGQMLQLAAIPSASMISMSQQGASFL